MDLLNLLGALGYAVTAGLFLILALLLLTSWRGRMQGGLLLLAAFVSATWAGVLAVQVAWQGISPDWLWVLEALRSFSWMLFLLRLLELQLAESQGVALHFRWLRGALVVVVLAVGLPVEHFDPQAAWLAPIDWTTVRLAFAVLLPVAGLTLIEQVYRNTPWEHRWGIKLLCVGVGGLFAYDFFFFADALLFKRLDADIWLARGAANAFVVPLIAVSAARNPQWSFNLFVSRKIAFHSTALVAAGSYLLIMALAGYYIRIYGGEWGSVVQTAFLFGAVLVLSVLLFSGYFRARVKVFVNKHFFTYKYDYREEWLHLISVLSGETLQASLAERIIFALSELVDSPGGALWLCSQQGACDHERCWNLPEDVVDLEEDFASVSGFLSRRQWVINLEEYRLDPDIYEGLTIPRWLAESERLWLIVPLTHEGRLLAIALLARPRAPQQVNWESLDLLKTAARQAASYLALEQAGKALSDARQFEGFNRLSAFVVHDLKNLIAQLSLVVKNAERHKHNPAFLEDAIITVSNSVDRMTRLLAQLKSAVPGNRADRVVLQEVLREAVAEHASGTTKPRLVLPLAEKCLLYADRDRFVAVLGHIIQNAQDAVSRDGHVTVQLVLEGARARIDVEDDGVGMDADFIRDRLFTPFDSTKGLAGMGIGAYECREFIRSLGGRVEVSSSPGSGTRFSMLLPLSASTVGSRTLSELA